MQNLLTVVVLAASSLAVSAQAVVLDLGRGGGAVPGNVSWSLDGGAMGAGEIYGIILATSEVQSELLPGVFVDVSLADLGLTFSLPGLLGTLDGNGKAAVSFPTMAPALVGLTVSAQAISGPGFDNPSNVTRTTLAVPGTFADTLYDPVLPIVGGIVVPDASNAGDVIFAGGSGVVPQRYRASREEFEAAGLTFGVGLLSQSTALADGRVLFTGGLDLAGKPIDAAGVWDPVSGTTTSLTMGTKRAGHSATLLSDGRVMIAGGFENVTIDLGAILTDPLSVLGVFQDMLNTTEFFDAGTGTFSGGPTMLEARALHTATAMPGGKVLVAGGMTLLPIVNIPLVSNTAYVFDPGLGSFGFPSFFTGPRLLHSAILQDDGTVLLVGGLSVDLDDFIATGDISTLVIGSRNDIVRYQQIFVFGTWSDVGVMSESRAGAGLARLPNGSILTAGGFRVQLSADLSGLDFGTTASCEVYTQGSGVSATGAMREPRVLPIMASLSDGTVLVVGGGGAAEVYQH